MKDTKLQKHHFVLLILHLEKNCYVSMYLRIGWRQGKQSYVFDQSVFHPKDESFKESALHSCQGFKRTNETHANGAAEHSCQVKPAMMILPYSLHSEMS